MDSILLTSDCSLVLSTTFHQNNISQVTVELVNPFTAGFEITQITCFVTSHGLALGTIQTATNFAAAGKSTTTSPPLDFNMNFDPPMLFTLTRVLAVQAGLNPAPLDGIVALGGYSYVTATNADSTPISRRSNIYTYDDSVASFLTLNAFPSGFDLPTFVDTAFKQLRSDVQLSAQLMIGTLSFLSPLWHP